MVASTVVPTSSSIENIPALNFSTTFPITSIASSLAKLSFMCCRSVGLGAASRKTPHPMNFRLPAVLAAHRCRSDIRRPHRAPASGELR